MRSCSSSKERRIIAWASRTSSSRSSRSAWLSSRRALTTAVSYAILRSWIAAWRSHVVSAVICAPRPCAITFALRAWSRALPASIGVDGRRGLHDLPRLPGSGRRNAWSRPHGRMCHFRFRHRVEYWCPHYTSTPADAQGELATHSMLVVGYATCDDASSAKHRGKAGDLHGSGEHSSRHGKLDRPRAVLPAGVRQSAHEISAHR